MNLNALQMVFVVLTAQYTFDISAGRRIWPLNIIRNYTCQYGHYSIPDKICLDVSYPCVSLCCSAGSSELVISGCPLPTDFNNSTLDGYKYWPNCCVRRAHTRRPGHPVALYYALDGSWRYRHEKLTYE
uniref:8.9 kDa family member n=1 Tax=Rhipicephalus appendiculatus TaxID=34631 RepID=A0A131Z5W9_RHIAP